MFTKEVPSFCFVFRHSEVFKELKKATLLTTIALATIALIGSVLSVCALNGVELAGINAVAQVVGESWTYLTLLMSSSVFLIDMSLIASLVRRYSHAQLSQKEIDDLHLTTYVKENRILEILEPGEHWDFIIQIEKVYAAVAIVKDYSGAVGVYAFRTKDDLDAKIFKLGYEDGQQCLTEEEIRNKLSASHEEPFKKWISQDLQQGAPLTFDFAIEIDDKLVPIYALRDETICFFFTSLRKRNLLLNS